MHPWRRAPGLAPCNEETTCGCWPAHRTHFVRLLAAAQVHRPAAHLEHKRPPKIQRNKKRRSQPVALLDRLLRMTLSLLSARRSPIDRGLGHSRRGLKNTDHGQRELAP